MKAFRRILASFLAACALACGLLAGCSRPDVDAYVSLSDLADALMEKAGVSDAVRLDVNSMQVLYGISPEWVLQADGFAEPYGDLPCEVVLVEAVSEDAARDVADCLQARLDQIALQARFAGQGVRDAVSACEVVRNGRFAWLVVAWDCEGLREYASYFL